VRPSFKINGLTFGLSDARARLFDFYLSHHLLLKENFGFGRHPSGHFMSRMLQDFPVTFRRAPTGRGGSTRHRRDADATQTGVNFVKNLRPADTRSVGF
jgi:hypothetical protein